MMKYFILLLCFLSSEISFAVEEKQPIHKLGPDIYLTNKVGVAISENIINLNVANKIKIYFVDGTELDGLVTKTELVSNSHFKVLGEITNKSNAGFGFIISKDGVFSGAIVLRDDDLTYTLDFSDEAKGYVFFKMPKKQKLDPI